MIAGARGAAVADARYGRYGRYCHTATSNDATAAPAIQLRPMAV